MADCRPVLRKVAILYQFPESWGNVSSVWEAMLKDDGLIPVVVLLPFIHQDYEWDRARSEEYLRSSGVPFVAWDEIDIARAEFSAVIFTSPYDETRPPEYSFASLREIIPYTVYIPYGLEVGGGDVNVALQYCQPVAANASAVFVRSESARDMYKKYCSKGAGHVHVTGHPRMDSFYRFEEFKVDPVLLKEIDGRKAILWNAHFSFHADLWSTFDIFASDILDFCAKRADIALIFRPNPLLWKKLINVGAFDKSGIDRLKVELRKKGVVLDERIDHRHAFKASTAMLSDVGTFLMEYLAVGKPVLNLVNPNGLGLNEEGQKVVQNYRSAATSWEIGEFLDDVLNGKQLALDRLSTVSEFFYGFDGCAGVRVVQHLSSQLNG